MLMISDIIINQANDVLLLELQIAYYYVIKLEYYFV